MRSAKIAIVSTLILGLLFTTSSGLAASQKSTSSQQKKAKNLTSNLIKGENSPKTDLEKYRTQLEAIKLILTNEKNEVKRYELFMRKANIHLMVAQALGFKRSDKAKMSADERANLNEAEKILNLYEPKLKNVKKQFAAILYMRGLIHFEYDRTAEMIDAFRQSIVLDPESKRVPSIALIIAEHLYDSDNYAEAIKYYTAYQKNMTPYQRALANYKVAWSYIGLSDYDKGFAIFLKQIRTSEKNSFTNDSIKDLSYFMAQTKTEEEIIQAAEINIPDLELRAKFYISAIESFMTIDRKDKVSALFTETLKIQKTSAEKLKTRLYKLQFTRREYPTHLEWELIDSLNAEIKAAPPEDREKFFFSYAADLEVVLEHYIKNVLDVYSGKAQARAGIKKGESFQILHDVIGIFMDLFPKSPKKITMWTILIDLCKEASQLQCLNDLAQKSNELAKTEEPYKQVYKKTLLARLVIWESAYDKAGDKNFEGFTTDAENFMSQFPTAPENVRISKKLVNVYLKHKSPDKALVHAERNIKAEPTAENYKSLLFIFFDKEDYNQILSMKDKIRSFSNPEMDDVLRETYIKLAEKYKKEDSFDKYIETVTSYLEMQKDPGKRSIVILDVMDSAIKKENMTLFIQFWELLTPENRKSKAFAGIKSDAINFMIQSGDFRTLKDFEMVKPVKFTEVVYKAAQKMPFNTEQWEMIQRMKLEQRLYFYSTFMLENPRILKIKLKDTNNAKEKKILETSKALNIGVLPKVHKKITKSKVIGRYKALRWPTEKFGVNKYSARAEMIVTEVRDLRKSSIAELKKLDLEEKLELLKAMALAEKKCSNMLTGSPLPPGLSPEQITEYQKGLADLAVEFDTQNADFTKLAEELTKKLDETVQVENDKNLPEFNSAKWPWPSNDISRRAQDLCEKKSLFAALVYIDRQLENKKIDNSDYTIIRTGLIAQVNRTEAGRELVRQEIVAANKEDLLVVWRGFSK